ncbi:hypothetical protein [Anaerococcus octavius]
MYYGNKFKSYEELKSVIDKLTIKIE